MEDPKNEEIIRPVLKGREIERFIPEWDHSFLINTHNGEKKKDIPPIDISEYPKLKAYLSSDALWAKVVKRSDQGDTPYNLRNCAYLDEFKKEKVIWKRIGSIMRFSYSDEEIYSLDSTCIATGEKIKYLTTLMNSKLMLYFLHKTSPKTGTGDCIISVQALEPLPVYYPDEQEENFFISLFEIIMTLKKAKSPIS